MSLGESKCSAVRPRNSGSGSATRLAGKWGLDVIPFTQNYPTTSRTCLIQRTRPTTDSQAKERHVNYYSVYATRSVISTDDAALIAMCDWPVP